LPWQSAQFPEFLSTEVEYDPYAQAAEVPVIKIAIMASNTNAGFTVASAHNVNIFMFILLRSSQRCDLPYHDGKPHQQFHTFKIGLLSSMT